MANLNGKKVLVTGADGFIGSHLTEALIDEGCDVRAFVFYNFLNSWGWLENIPKNKIKNVEVFAGDIRDANGVSRAIKDVDVVFHLAALIGIPFSYHSPDSYVDTNIKGTLNVLQASRHHGVKKVIVTSTSEVYGTARYVPIDESHPLQGQSPYSATKIAADKIAESFHTSFDLPVIIARPFNTYGPRQSARAVIPTIVTQIMSNAGVIRLGNVSSLRDFTYVTDTCRGFIEIAKCRKAIGKAINICSGQEISVGGLAELISRKMGCRKKIEFDEARIRPEKSEVERLLGDNSLLRSMTGWSPTYDIGRGLTQVIEWFKRPENIVLYKSGIYNI